MKLEEIKFELEHFMTPGRYIHAINVMNCAADLASRYGVSREKAAVAGLLHDCVKDLPREEILRLCDEYGVEVDNVSLMQPELLHGPLGARIAREEYGIEDESVLKAISSHTTGEADMDMLAKITYLADYIEPDRRFPGVDDIRRAAFRDIDSAMVMALNRTIKHVIAKGALIHPATIAARNSMILCLKKRAEGLG
jgi:predicted HD superfamily hydrolase involved in NAD metabolism